MRVGELRVGELRVGEMRVGKLRIGEMRPNLANTPEVRAIIQSQLHEYSLQSFSGSQNVFSKELTPLEPSSPGHSQIYLAAVEVEVASGRGYTFRLNFRF